MNELKNFWEKVTKKNKSLLIGSFFVVLLCLFWLTRSCSSQNQFDRFYVIARDLNWAPLQLYGKEKNFRIFSDELLLAIAKLRKFQVQIISVPAIDLFEGLDKHQYDAIFSAETPDALNQVKYMFSDPFYYLGLVLVVPASSPVTSLSEMEGKTIGIRSGTSLIFEVDNFPTVLLVTYNLMTDALRDLENDKIDGIIIDALTAYLYTQGFYNDKYKVATSPFTKKGLRLVARREPHSIPLIEDFNKGLQDLKKNKDYELLLETWDIVNTEVKPQT